MPHFDCRPIHLRLSLSDALKLRRLLSALRVDLQSDSDEAAFVDARVFELQNQVSGYLFPRGAEEEAA